MTEFRLIDLIHKLLPHMDLTIPELFPDEKKAELIASMQEFKINEALNTLDFKGQPNQHLANPLNLEGCFNNTGVKTCYYFQEREIPLTGEEIIRGDFLLYDYCGHDGVSLIYSLDSLEDIAELIVDGGGYTNPFTSYQIPVVYGQIKSFQVFYTTDGEEFLFYKQDPPSFEQEMTNIRLIWLD